MQLVIDLRTRLIDLKLLAPALDEFVLRLLVFRFEKEKEFLELNRLSTTLQKIYRLLHRLPSLVLYRKHRPFLPVGC